MIRNPSEESGHGSDPGGPGGPGASSGGEQRAEQRVVPGTASAAEGYRQDQGTAGGSPLDGVEIDPAEAEKVSAAPDADEADAGPVRRGRGG